MTSSIPTSPLESGQPVAAALRPIHPRWLERARWFLEPAIAPGADFWDRLAAVRYLADEFSAQLDWERALVSELRPFLPPAVASQLTSRGDEIARLRLELDHVGRRRGSAAESAGRARVLLEELGRWCEEIEVAASRLTQDQLPSKGAAILAHLEATT